jgi:hypothetical protein
LWYLQAWLPDFSLSNVPKWGEYNELPLQMPNCQKNKANGHKAHQMVIKDAKNFHSKGFQSVPKLWVWFENKPSGNPVFKTK